MRRGYLPSERSGLRGQWGKDGDLEMWGASEGRGEGLLLLFLPSSLYIPMPPVDRWRGLRKSSVCLSVVQIFPCFKSAFLFLCFSSFYEPGHSVIIRYSPSLVFKCVLLFSYTQKKHILFIYYTFHIHIQLSAAVFHTQCTYRKVWSVYGILVLQFT